ncbi:hypothetical protein [Staphylococcus aureus]|uniref:hypothetical protein n=1 Tax=Staphylococcus aureus TaxID=1280 RepID=UPI00255AC4A8|nr:hypothetical protein [Staphylococcus aureus]
MNNSTNYKRLKANLEYLKMNQMINHLDDVIDFSMWCKLSHNYQFLSYELTVN